jgi:hypothetical protein
MIDLTGMRYLPPDPHSETMPRGLPPGLAKWGRSDGPGPRKLAPMEDQVITTAPGAFVTAEQPAHCLGWGPCSRPEHEKENMG